MTDAPTRAVFRPVPLTGPAGRLFAVWYPPSPDVTGPGFDLLCLPPFAEEMNRCRRMVALQARSLAARGIGVLTVDLYGTGDSGGDFCDARWPIWIGDAGAAVDWLVAETGRPIGLWGIRFGGLVALALAEADPDRFARLALWNPVANGQTMITQVLRIRIAAEMGRADQDGADTRTLRQWLADGREVEVAGYALHPELVAAIDGLRLGAFSPPARMPVDWFELVGEAGRPLPPASRSIIEAWQKANCSISVHQPAGPPFWSLPDTTECPALDLVAATSNALAG